MSLLEERILRIIELRAQGKATDDIARELNIDTVVVQEYEQFTKQAIQHAIEYGYRSIEKIAKRIGLSPITASMVMHHYETEIPPQKTSTSTTITREKQIDAIRKAIEIGASSIRAAAEKTGINYWTALRYANELGVKMKEQRKKTFLEAIEAGAPSIGAAAAKIGIHYRTALRYAHESGVKVQRSSEKEHKAIEELAKEGFSLNEIAGVAKLSRQRIEQIIRSRGVHDACKAARMKRKESEKYQAKEEGQAKARIVNLLHERVQQLAEKASWPEQKTVEYMLSRRNQASSRSYSPEKLLKLFTLYGNAQRQGKQISLSELSEKTGIPFPMGVSKVLKKVGLEPMYKTQEMVTTPTEIKHALKRAEQIPMSCGDLGYFLNIPDYTVQEYFARQKKKHSGEAIAQFGPRKALTWRKASEIYEAVDARFKKKDLCELLDSTSEVVNCALKLRESVEPVIISVLQTLYNDKTITTPYYHKK